jgi:hypothetical protein
VWALVERHGACGVGCEEGGGGVVWGLEVGEALLGVSLGEREGGGGRNMEMGMVEAYISQHVVKTRWLWALSIRAVGAGVFGLFFLQVEEEFVV